MQFGQELFCLLCVKRFQHWLIQFQACRSVKPIPCLDLLFSKLEETLFLGQRFQRLLLFFSCKELQVLYVGETEPVKHCHSFSKLHVCIEFHCMSSLCKGAWYFFVQLPQCDR